MAQYAKLGLCKAVLVPLDCDGALDLAAPQLTYCGLTDIEVNPVLTEGLDLNDPSGQPNKDCVKIKIDPEFDYFEVVLTTCSLFDTKVDSLLGYSEEMLSTPGTRAMKKGNASCICDCGDDACEKRVALVTWSLAVCSDGSPHPDGKYVISVFPALQFRPNTFTRTTNRELNGRQYLSISYENPDFGQGPTFEGSPILPADEAPFDRCYYEFVSPICPPAGCDCGTCGGDSATTQPTPARRAATATAGISAGSPS